MAELIPAILDRLAATSGQDSPWLAHNTIAVGAVTTLRCTTGGGSIEVCGSYGDLGSSSFGLCPLLAVEFPWSFCVS